VTGFTEKTFELLGQLEENNNRMWYEENKASLKEHARLPFAGMLSISTMLLEGSRYPLIGSDKTMFRQNRDIRFSKDKTLYKSYVSGMLTPTGTNKERAGVVYAQVGPLDGRLAAGFYQLETAQLNLVRDRIIADAANFNELVETLEAKGYPLSTHNTLKTMPRGFKQHESHPLASYLKLKGYTVRQDQPKEVWLNGDIVERLVALAEIIGPMNAWLRNALSYDAR